MRTISAFLKKSVSCDCSFFTVFPCGTWLCHNCTIPTDTKSMENISPDTYKRKKGRISYINCYIASLCGRYFLFSLPSYKRKKRQRKSFSAVFLRFPSETDIFGFFVNYSSSSREKRSPSRFMSSIFPSQSSQSQSSQSQSSHTSSSKLKSQSQKLNSSLQS